MKVMTLLARRGVCLLFAALLSASALPAAATGDAFLGRWALTLPDDRAGWLEIKRENGWLDGSILWGGGSVLPVGSVVIANDELTVTRLREVPRRDAAGTIVRRQQFTDVITARVRADTLQLEVTTARPDGSGFDRHAFTGRRIPPLPPRPNLAQVKFAAPIELLNDRDLTGWRLLEPQAPNGWAVEHGVLVNRPVQVEGQPSKRYGNLRTDREFEDFNLQLEVKVPERSNSGVYLRGLYEVQVFDSHGKPLDTHNMGAIYSRIAPTVAAEKPAGEWQQLDMTLVDRHVTVRLNGTTIIDNQPLAGCTGGALWSDESRPGPVYLQGDHGPVEYRHIVIRPVLK